MAASGKKNKKRWKSVAFNDIIDSVPARKPVIGNWADEVDEEDANSYELKTERVVLPTAPRASRGTTIDENKIPSIAPFQAYLSNIPYDLTENELINFFQNLKVKNVRIPRDEKGGNRAKGFGYIEFEDRASLVAALNLGDNTLKGRPIRIELTTNVDNSNRSGGRGGRGNRDGGRSDMGGGGSDRTAGNWRTGPRADDFDDRGGGGSGYDRGGYGNRRDYGGGGGGGGGAGFNRGFEERGFFRDERGGGMDRDRFGRDDRVRDDRRGGFSQGGGFDRGGGGGGGGFGRERDDRGFSRERDDRGFGSFSDRSERGGGFSRRDDDRHREDRGSSVHWREDSNYNRMDDRRERDRFGGRRDDLPPADRGSTEVRTRPKLKLQPRSKPSPSEGEVEVPAANSSIFGGARPVDTAAREREIEERLRRGEEPPDLRAKSVPGSSVGAISQKENVEKSTEPAPPPKENAWTRKATSPSVVNNGRSSPEEVRQSSGGHLSDEDKNEPTRSWNRGSDTRRQEPKRIEENRSRGPQQKGGTGGNISSEKRGKDEKQNSKHRDGRKEVDDISRMPKIQESKVPNFAGSNKFSTLLDSDETPLE